jgi:MYXO-CTERM domain-containing protein
MKRLGLLLLGSLALAFFLPAGAHAQSGAIQPPLVVKRDGKQLNNDPAIYGTKEDCDNNVDFEFSLTYSSTVPIVEAWMGVGGTDCSKVENRTKASTTATAPACKLLGTDRKATTTPHVTAPAVQVFSKAQGASNPMCDEARNQLYTVYVIPLDQETNIDANMAYPAKTVGTISTRTVTFTLFTLALDPPTDVSGLSGESQIGIKFKPIQGAQAKTRYKAYFDWGFPGGSTDSQDAGADEDASADVDAGVDAAVDEDAGVDDAGTNADANTGASGGSGADAASEPPSCGSGIVRTGAPPPRDNPDVEGVTGNSSPIYLKDLESRGVGYGEKVAVAVVTIDAAGNESDLSEAVCVERVETASFLDNCKRDPDCKDGFNTCSLSPGARAGGLAGLLLLGLGAVFAVRRRSRV